MVIPVKTTHDVIEIDSDPVRFQTQCAVFNQLGVRRELFYQVYFFGKGKQFQVNGIGLWECYAFFLREFYNITDTGMGILHVVYRVFVALFFSDFQIKIEVGIGPPRQKAVLNCIGSHFINHFP